jgi:hypothetical protein
MRERLAERVETGEWCGAGDLPSIAIHRSALIRQQNRPLWPAHGPHRKNVAAKSHSRSRPELLKNVVGDQIARLAQRATLQGLVDDAKVQRRADS